MFRITIVVAATTMAFSGGLDAQQHGKCRMASDSSAHAVGSGGVMGMMQGGMMQGGMMGMMGMMPAHKVVMEAMRFGPARVAELGEELNLTDEQIAALDRLRQSATATPHGHMASARTDSETLAGLFEAEVPDTAAIRAAAGAVFQPQIEMHVEMLVKAAAVKRLLTPAQRELVMAGGGESGMHCVDGGSQEHEN